MPELRVLIFIGSVTLVLSLFVFHLHRRVTRTLGLPRWASRAFLSLVISGLASALVVRFVGEGSLARALGSYGGVMSMGILVSAVLLWPYELGRIVFALVRSVRAKAFRKAEPILDAQPEDTSRRTFLGQAAVGSALGVGFGAASYGGLFGRHDYEIESVPVKLDKLPKALDGFTIVQLSDLHVGLYVGEREFRAGLELVKRAKPDIIVLTGDLVDHDPRYARELGRFVSELRSAARRGLFAIPGNHDYYAGVRPVLRALDEAGAEILLNRHVEVGDSARFVLGGVDDVSGWGMGGPGPSADNAFRDAPPDLARVLLSHNPSYYVNAHKHADLTLSGHTHGGQITLFVNPAELVLGHGLVRGLYHKDGSQIYVNRGFGTAGPPVRVGSPPEITKLILTASA